MFNNFFKTVITVLKTHVTDENNKKIIFLYNLKLNYNLIKTIYKTYMLPLIIFSRYDTKRVFTKLTDDLIEFTSFETLYYTGTGDNFNDLDAIDPDGGPYICKGYKIKFKENEQYIVERFSNIEFDDEKEYLKVLLHVKKIEE